MIFQFYFYISLIFNLLISAKRTPFMVTFDTDSYEFSAELNDATAPYIPANSGTTGFKLVYTQSSSNC